MSQLPNAPLQEVIFEIRWALKPGKELGQIEIVDQDFELASGRLSSVIEKEFTFYKRIVPKDLPEQFLNYIPVHQYWISENKWPVLQLGPGIFTINCTDEDYDWETGFRQLIEKGIGWLIEAYKQPLNFQFASLKYIDAINVENYGSIKNGWSEFIKSHFNFEYYNKFNTRGRQKRIQVNQTFELTDKSELQLFISDGITKNKKALIWQTSVMKKATFKTTSELINWADYAHSITHELFKEMIKPDLYVSFSTKNKN